MLQTSDRAAAFAAIDLRDCDRARLADPNAISAFVCAAAAAIGRRADSPLRLVRFGEAGLQGWSATQLIDGGSIAVHADEVAGRCFIDVFACRPGDAAVVSAVAAARLGGRV